MTAEEAATLRKARALIAMMRPKMGGPSKLFADMILEDIDEHLAPKRAKLMPPITFATGCNDVFEVRASVPLRFASRNTASNRGHHGTD